MKKLYIETYGCQMNVADSEVVASVMQMAGYETTDRLEEADAVFLNTCSVRDNAEQKIFRRLEALNSVKRQRIERIARSETRALREEDNELKRITRIEEEPQITQITQITQKEEENNELKRIKRIGQEAQITQITQKEEENNELKRIKRIGQEAQITQITLREEEDNELKRIARNNRQNPLIIGVLGCMAERVKEELMEKWHCDLVAGPDAYLSLPDLVAQAELGHQAMNIELSTTETYRDVVPQRIGLGHKIGGFVSIMRGCNNFCHYCIVPYTRGRERSRDVESILREVRDLRERGYKEITLLGQNVNSYRSRITRIRETEPQIEEDNELKRITRIGQEPQIAQITLREEENNELKRIARIEEEPQRAQITLREEENNELKRITRIGQEPQITQIAQKEEEDNELKRIARIGQEPQIAQITLREEENNELKRIARIEEEPQRAQMAQSEIETVDFAKLLRMVAEEAGEMRVRFTTSHPKDMSDETLRVIAEVPNVCKHIHLPVQSGSNRILGLMNRKYTIEWYLDRVAAIRRIIPDCGLSTDIFVGYHSETEEDHQMSLQLMREVGYDSAFMFKYSERPGTYASKHLPDDVPEEVKIRRLNELIALQTEISAQRNKMDEGKTFEVLVEGFSKRSREQLCGRTEQNKMVVFPKGDHHIGERVNVKIIGSTSATLLGEE